METNKSESRDVKRLAFTNRKRIIIRNFVCAVPNYRKEGALVKVKA
jgi:hypothetical protein